MNLRHLMREWKIRRTYHPIHAVLKCLGILLVLGLPDLAAGGVMIICLSIETAAALWNDMDYLLPLTDAEIRKRRLRIVFTAAGTYAGAWLLGRGVWEVLSRMEAARRIAIIFHNPDLGALWTGRLLIVLTLVCIVDIGITMAGCGQAGEETKHWKILRLMEILPGGTMVLYGMSFSWSWFPVHPTDNLFQNIWMAACIVGGILCICRRLKHWELPDAALEQAE